MTKRWRIPLSVLLLLLASVGSCEELRDIRNRIDALEKSLSREAVDLKNAQSEIQAIERDLHGARQKAKSLQLELARKSERIEALGERRIKLNSRYGSFKKTAEELILLSFKQTRQSKLKILLNNRTINELQRDLKYYDYIVRANQQRYDQVAKAVLALNQVERALKLEATSLRRAKSANTSLLEELRGALTSRTKLAQKLNKLVVGHRSELANLHENAKRLQELLTDVAKEEEFNPELLAPMSESKGELRWPVDGHISKAPGSAMRDGGAKWGGVIIDARPGVEVKAIAPGKIAFADWFRNLGLLVIVDHGDGYMSLYGHNNEIFKSTGESVAAGDTLATVGDTGGRSRTGLYFEIRHNGSPQDPRQWCKR